MAFWVWKGEEGKRRLWKGKRGDMMQGQDPPFRATSLATTLLQTGTIL